METGGMFKGSRSYRVAGKRRGDQQWKKRKRLYVHDSWVNMQGTYEYVNRVEADGGHVDLASIICVNYVLYNLTY